MAITGYVSANKQLAALAAAPAHYEMHLQSDVVYESAVCKFVTVFTPACAALMKQNASLMVPGELRDCILDCCPYTKKELLQQSGGALKKAMLVKRLSSRWARATKARLLSSSRAGSMRSAVSTDDLNSFD